MRTAFHLEVTSKQILSIYSNYQNEVLSVNKANNRGRTVFIWNKLLSLQDSGASYSFAWSIFTAEKHRKVLSCPKFTCESCI